MDKYINSYFKEFKTIGTYIKISFYKNITYWVVNNISIINIYMFELVKYLYNNL